MHPDLHRYLDGDLPRDALPPELAAEAAEWEALIAAAAGLRIDRAPLGLEARIMDALPAPGPWRRLARWLLAPRSIRIRPVTLALAAAAALALLLRPDGAATDAPAVTAPVVGAQTGAPAGESGTFVQFVYVSADAQSVALAGDFNGWDAERHQLRDLDGDGVWTGFFALPVGLHKYMFVVNGQQWVTDPRADRYVDDGFGMRNALISVTPNAVRSS